MTLTQFEQSLLPTAVPPLSRSAATQCAGAAASVREQLGRGISWAEAQTRVVNHPRHAKQLAQWNQAGVFAALTGP